MTIAATAIFIAVCVLMPFAPTFSAVLLLYLALGIAKSLFTPQVQAFVGDVVAYEGFDCATWCRTPAACPRACSP